MAGGGRVKSLTCSVLIELAAAGGMVTGGLVFCCLAIGASAHTDSLKTILI